MSDAKVLIVGAGPTGLVLALWLTKLGVKPRSSTRRRARTTSRALAVQARTLEFYRQVGLADAVVDGGHTVPGALLWVGGEQKARVPFEQSASAWRPTTICSSSPRTSMRPC